MLIDDNKGANYMTKEDPGFRYKIGDKVKIRQEEEIPISWDWDPESMSKYCGTETTVEQRITEFDNKRFYLLAADDKKYYWTDEMLDPVEGGKAIEVKESGVDNAYTPEFACRNIIYKFEHGAYLSMYLYSFPEDSGLGKIVGNYRCDICDINENFSSMEADIEGGRKIKVTVEVTK